MLSCNQFIGVANKHQYKINSLLKFKLCRIETGLKLILLVIENNKEYYKEKYKNCFFKCKGNLPRKQTHICRAYSVTRSCDQNK